MRDKAEKRRNDYLKAKKKERIFSAKSHDKDESKRGFFGKLRKGKIPFTKNPNGSSIKKSSVPHIQAIHPVMIAKSR